LRVKDVWQSFECVHIGLVVQIGMLYDLILVGKSLKLIVIVEKTVVVVSEDGLVEN
jgi:hypothetical protein